MAANGFPARIRGGVASPFVGGSFADGSLLGGVLLFRVELAALGPDRDSKMRHVGRFYRVGRGLGRGLLTREAVAADVRWGVMGGLGS